MASRSKTKARARADRQLQLIEDELRRDLKAGLPGARNLDTGAVLKALRALGALELSAAEHAKLRAKLLDSLQKVMKELRFTAEDLGTSNLDQLAELFVRMLERVRYSRYSISELRRKAVGLRGVFAGELFEQLVLHLRELQKDLKDMARFQLDLLNTVFEEELRIARGAGGSAANTKRHPRILNALGQPIPPMMANARFTGIHRAVDIFVHVGGKKLKFTDFAYISYLKDARGTVLGVSFLVEGEIKLPRAAAKFSEQIGSTQGRFAGAEKVEMTIEGRSGTVIFAPGDILFDRASINRFAMTTTRRSTNTYRQRSTTKGGYPEAYLRIGLAVNVDDLRRLVNILFRR